MSSRALRAATIALFATGASVAAPASVRAQDITCEQGDLEVRGLEFRGNRAIDDDDLAVRVTTTPSSVVRRALKFTGQKRCLDRRQLARDLLSLRQYYRNRGFYQVTVDTLVQTLDPQAVRVIFSIGEGEPTLVTAYDVTGLGGVPDSADIMRRLQLRVGGRFDFGLFNADLDSIVSRLRNQGHYRVIAVPAFERVDSTREVRAEIGVVPGKVARFGEPLFDIAPAEGRTQQIATPIVRRVLGIPTGDPYSDRAILAAQRSLFQLATYRQVEVAPLPDSLQPPGDTIVVLKVQLTEDLMRQLDSEFGWATLDCVRLRLQYTDKNLLGTARRFELTGQASKIGYGDPVQTRATRDFCEILGGFLGRSSAIQEDSVFSQRLHYFTGATFRQPRLLGTRWVPTVSLYSERRGEFKAYLRSTHVGADVSATRELGDRTPLRLGYSMEYGQTEAPDAAFCALFNRCDEQSRRSVEELATLGVASVALVRMRTDNPINPSRGTVFRGEVRTSASRLLGTSENLFFNKGTGDLTWFRPLGGRNVLALRLRGGAVLGRQLSLTDPTGFIPPQERLYAGGPTSVRGFQQNELGAVVYIARTRDVRIEPIPPGTDPDTTYRFHVSAHPDSSSLDRTVPLGGNSLVVTNVEYRARVPFFLPDLLQFTFFVDGGDVWTRSVPSQFRFKLTPGFGVRALTSIPVQVNIGYNGYPRERGALYYNPDVSTLACATPGNRLTYRKDPVTNQYTPTTSEPCDDFSPPLRNRFFQKLTFTFSIGSDF